MLEVYKDITRDFLSAYKVGRDSIYIDSLLRLLANRFLQQDNFEEFCQSFVSDFKNDPKDGAYRPFILNSPQDLITVKLFFWPSPKMLSPAQIAQGKFRTPIHSHPFQCAFIPLVGVLLETQYLSCGDTNHVVEKSCQIFSAPEIGYDNQSQPYIHSMQCHSDLDYAMSLHLYEASPSQIDSLYTARHYDFCV